MRMPKGTAFGGKSANIEPLFMSAIASKILKLMTKSWKNKNNLCKKKKI